MVKRKDDATVICRDITAVTGKYLSAFVCLVLFTIAIIWVTGMWRESDFSVPGFVLLAIAALFFLGFYTSVKSIIHIEKEKALLTVNNDGIKIFEDKFRYWADIEIIQLTTEFDQKYIAVQCIDPQENMNYGLSSAWETAEFKDLHKLKDVLDKFTDKVLLCKR